MTSSLNILIAYPYFQKSPEAYIKSLNRVNGKFRFLLDSGAFTAWKAGNEINIDDYCSFLENIKIKPWRYFTLDKIGDPIGTQKNYETMLKRGFNPIPIFTRGESLSVLEEFYKTSDVVGIGGLVGTQKNKGFVRGIMKHVGKRLVHWLGFTDIQFLKYFRPYMCDSSTWESGARYGTLRLYLGKGKFVSINKQEFKDKPKKEILDRIKWLGVDPYVMSKVDSWHGGNSFSRSLCARSGVALSVDVEKNIKTKLFLATATPLAVDLLVDGFNELYGGKK